MERVRVVEKLDPFASLHDPKMAVTLAEIINQHISIGFQDGRSTTNAISLYSDLQKALGEYPLRSVTYEVLKKHIEEDYRHRPSSAYRLLANLHTAYRLAARANIPVKLPAGIVDPTVGLKKDIKWLANFRHGSYAVSWTPEQWAIIREGFRKGYAACQDVKHSHHNLEVHLLFLELLMLTGARPGEIKTLEWGHIRDLPIRQEDGSYVIHRVIIKERHKTWKKTKRPRRIILNAGCLSVLERAKAMREREGYKGSLVFFSRAAKATGKDQHPWVEKAADAMRGFASMPDFQIYNFRSAYINRALDHLGFNALELIAENVGHDVQTTLKYYRQHRDDRLTDAVHQVGESFATDFGFLWDIPETQAAVA